MANDIIRSYENAAEMTDFWLKKIVPRYFNPDSLNTYRAGTLGYITDILSTTTEDTFHAMMIAKREVLPNTAQYLSSLYLHAAARLMDAPMANPAVATVMLMIQQSDILKFGTQEGDLHTFILDDTFIADVGGLKFMLDYPITILSMKRENGKYAHTTHYDFYMKNSLMTSEEKYLANKTVSYRGTDYLIMQTRMRQLQKSIQSALVTSNAVVNTVTMNFNYDGKLANFEVFYQENDSSPRVQLIKLMQDSVISHDPFCWYKLKDDETITLTFPANIYFVPRLNSVITIEIATTEGADGNFEHYDVDITSENDSTRYPYNRQVPVFGTVDGAAEGGTDLMSKEEFRKAVMRAYCTNMTFISENDLQLYFDTLMTNTTDRFKFTKQRDDSFVRLHGAFLRMKDSADNVVPTNTLDVNLDPQEEAADFDIYSDAVKRFIIKPGALFHYYHDDDHKYVVRRIKDRNLLEDLDEYDGEGVWTCGKCGHLYTGEGDMGFLIKNPASEYTCPHCGADKLKFRKDNFVFTNPYLISISTDNFIAGYFLNSIDQGYNIRYTGVNDSSIVQFIAKDFRITRNAIAGENFYRFQICVTPSVVIPWETIATISENDYVVAAHNGYISKVEYDKDAVYTTVTYTDDPTLPTGAELTTPETRIQTSSYVTRTNQDFRICPVCGRRLTLDIWEKMDDDDFFDITTQEVSAMLNHDTGDLEYTSEENRDPRPCPQCIELGMEDPALLIEYQLKHIEYDYMNGYKMNFNVGDRVSKNDIIAERMPQDLGRIRIMLNLGNVMTSSAKRYIPMTIEKADLEADTPYMVFAGYIATDDMIDSKMIMQVKDGFIMQDGNTAHDTPISIPISGLEMEIFAFYEYREDDDLDIAVRNPVHAMSRFHYASSHTYTNTYSLRENDRITLIKALDHARGFLDVYEREDIWTPPDWEDPDKPKPDEPDPPPIPEDHPPGEEDEHPEDSENYVFLRTVDHERLKVDEPDNDRYDYRYLTVGKRPLPGTPGVGPGIITPWEPEDPDPGIDNPTNPGSSVNKPQMPFGGNFMYLLRNCPFVAANWIKKAANEKYFIQRIYERYSNIEDMQARLQNAFAIDMKFYNTYGRSKFYMIGNKDNLEVLDSVNVSFRFGAGIIFPASAEVFRENFKNFVRQYIEAADDVVGNGRDLYLLNMVTAAKVNFEEIGFLEYYGINNYDYFAQRLVVMSDEEILKTVSPDAFVPEFLNIVRETIDGSPSPKVQVTIVETDTNPDNV